MKRVKVTYRIHACFNCKKTFARQVKFGPTPNISGELTEYCPQCNKAFDYAGEAMEMPVEFDSDRVLDKLS